jgi:O-antigen/teichoic acid export membrane protein
MVPMYVAYMGTEAYGLVGFFAMLQVWFQLLDVGLTPTMARETARYNGGAIDAQSLRRLLRAMEGIFVGVALVAGTSGVLGAAAVAHGWLKVQHLQLSEVEHAISLIAWIIALRWVCGLYRGAITGFEKLVWLSGFNITIATGRFVLVIPFFVYVGTSPSEFFAYQLVLAVVELVVLVAKTYSLLPEVALAKRTPWEWAPLRGVLKFSGSIAATSSLWVMITQADKLLLSKLLPLTDYAYFTLGVLMASGVIIISGPISSALLPRLSKLAAEGRDAELVRLYRNATQLVSVIAIPTALMLALFSEHVLWAWTGNAEMAQKAAPVLTLYALGNGILALAAFPYYLQFAKGDLKLHVIGSVFFGLMLIPGVIWATLNYGVTGAGWAWLTANAIYFVFWIPIVHRRFLKNLHLNWLLRDVGVMLLLAGLGVFLADSFIIWPYERANVALQISGVGLAVLALATTGSEVARRILLNAWRTSFNAKKSEKK